MSTIGITGPVDLNQLTEFIEKKQPVPSGLGGTVLPPLIKEYIVNRKHQVILFTLDQNVKKTTILEGNGLKIWIGPYRTRHRARDFFAVERDFLRDAIQHENQISFLHAHWTYEFALAALDSGKPTLVTAHDAPLMILRYDPTPYRIVRTIMAFAVAKKARYMTAVSDYVGLHIQNAMRYPGHITTIPNGLEASSFPQKKEIKNTSQVFASSVNGWGQLKNTQTLIKAFSLVQNELPQAQLWLFGSDHGPGEIAEKWAIRQGITKNIHFLGFTNYYKMLELMANNVDILVHPAREESFSMIIAEAMMMGIPVIAGANSGGVTSTLAHGDAGCMVNVNSAEEMAQSMLNLAASPDTQRTLTQIAKKYALDNFSMGSVADRYENIYKALELNG